MLSIHLAFPPSFCTLQAIKNLNCGRLGNKGVEPEHENTYTPEKIVLGLPSHLIACARLSTRFAYCKKLLGGHRCTHAWLLQFQGSL